MKFQNWQFSIVSPFGKVLINNKALASLIQFIDKEEIASSSAIA
jgi:hypothetical protein